MSLGTDPLRIYEKPISLPAVLNPAGHEVVRIVLTNDLRLREFWYMLINKINLLSIEN